MIRHIVFFKNEDSAKVEKLRDMLLELEDKMDFVLDLEVGIDLVHSQRSFDLALTVTLPSIAHLDLYANHEAHLPVIEWVKANGFESKAVDYEL